MVVKQALRQSSAITCQYAAHSQPLSQQAPNIIISRSLILKLSLNQDRLSLKKKQLDKSTLLNFSPQLLFMRIREKRYRGINNKNNPLHFTKQANIYKATRILHAYIGETDKCTYPEISFSKNFLCSYFKLIPLGKLTHSWLSKIKILHRATWCVHEISKDKRGIKRTTLAKYYGSVVRQDRLTCILFPLRTNKSQMQVIHL